MRRIPVVCIFWREQYKQLEQPCGKAQINGFAVPVVCTIHLRDGVESTNNWNLTPPSPQFKETERFTAVFPKGEPRILEPCKQRSVPKEPAMDLSTG